MIRSQLTEILPIFVIPEDVMIATDEHFVTVESFENPKTLTCHGNIPQKITLVVGFYSFIMSPHHLFVHLFGRSERTQRTTVGSFENCTGLFMTKMMVRGKPH